MINTITLTREQINKLAKIAQGFPEVDYFDVIQDSMATHAQFDYFESHDTTIEITDSAQ